MSRFYTDEPGDYPSHWFEQDLERRIASRNGQRALRDFRDALEAMPKRELVHGAIVTSAGGACAVGVYALAKGLDLSQYMDAVEEYGDVTTIEIGRRAGLAKALAIQIGYMNDEWFPAPNRIGGRGYSDAQRWDGIHKWVVAHIRTEAGAASEEGT
jgi:hypothetical protein